MGDTAKALREGLSEPKMFVSGYTSLKCENRRKSVLRHTGLSLDMFLEEKTQKNPEGNNT